MDKNEKLNIPSTDVNVINHFLTLLLKKCKTFFSHDNVQLEKKLYDLNILRSLWKKKADEGKLLINQKYLGLLRPVSVPTFKRLFIARIL